RSRRYSSRVLVRPEHELLQAPHLLGAVEVDELGGYRPFHATEPGPQVAGQQQDATDHIGRSGGLVGSAADLPERIAPQTVVLGAVAEEGSQARRRTRTDGPVVHTRPLDEGSGPPSLKPRRRHRGPVDAASGDRDVASDLGEAGAPEHLTCSRHVFDGGEAIVVVSAVLDEGSPGDTKTLV